ncbi:MAG: glycosyltransferase 87 family protein [Acidobacteriota bacterium]
MAGSARSRRSRLIRTSLLAAVAALLTYVVSSSVWRTTHGFIAYYTAARLLLEGRLGPSAYDDGWFGAVVQAFTGTDVLEIFSPNPPTMALMAVPIAWLDPGVARAVWLFASLAAASVAAFALARYREQRAMPRTVIVMAIVMLNPAMFANLRTGQGYLFVFAMLAGAALTLIGGRDRVAGALLGLALALKAAGAPLLLLLIWMRRWQAVKSVLVAAAITVAVAAAFVETDMWTRYPPAVVEFIERPAGSATAYQTTLSLFRRLCIADERWNPRPAADCAPIAFMVPATLIVAALGATLMLARRSPTGLWVAAGLCLSELALPAAAEPHFLLFAAALVLIPTSAISLTVFTVLYVVPLAYTAEVFTDGWRVIAAYPRLYAAWLLWALALRGMLRCAPASDARARRSAGMVGVA